MQRKWNHVCTHQFKWKNIARVSLSCFKICFSNDGCLFLKPYFYSTTFPFLSFKFLFTLNCSPLKDEYISSRALYIQIYLIYIFYLLFLQFWAIIYSVKSRGWWLYMCKIHSPYNTILFYYLGLSHKSFKFFKLKVPLNPSTS